MNRNFIYDLDKISAPKDKADVFSMVKSFCQPFIKSVDVTYVNFNDSEYEVVVGFNFSESAPSDPTFEFCFKYDEVLLVYFREAN